MEMNDLIQDYLGNKEEGLRSLLPDLALEKRA